MPPRLDVCSESKAVRRSVGCYLSALPFVGAWVIPFIQSCSRLQSAGAVGGSFEEGLSDDARRSGGSERNPNNAMQPTANSVALMRETCRSRS